VDPLFNGSLFPCERKKRRSRPDPDLFARGRGHPRASTAALGVDGGVLAVGEDPYVFTAEDRSSPAAGRVVISRSPSIVPEKKG
jgi:hypothetical protein